jgi:hypothetical protein
MEYDYLPGPLPSGWSDTKIVWLDANDCWTGEVAAPQQAGAFTVDSKPWTPTVEGKIIDAIGVRPSSLPSFVPSSFTLIPKNMDSHINIFIIIS